MFDDIGWAGAGGTIGMLAGLVAGVLVSFHVFRCRKLVTRLERLEAENNELSASWRPLGARISSHTVRRLIASRTCDVSGSEARL
jgi:hypothetical protein